MANKLTAKQEAFCLLVVEGVKITDAYRQAYGVGNRKPETVRRAAVKVDQMPAVQARIAELKAPAIERAQLTYEAHLERLRMLSEAAESKGQFGPAITAEISRGKAAGFYVEKVDHSSKDGSMSPAGVGAAVVAALEKKYAK